MNIDEAYLREYQKAVDLFMFEVRLAWELVYIYLAVQIGLVSAFVILGTREPSIVVTSWGYLLFLAGFASSLAWFLILHRSKMWRRSWILRGLKIERELKDRGLLLDIFKTEYSIRTKNLALELFNDKIRYRNQFFYEKISALGLIHNFMFVLGVIWLGALLWVLLF